MRILSIRVAVVFACFCPVGLLWSQEGALEAVVVRTNAALGQAWVRAAEEGTLNRRWVNPADRSGLTEIVSGRAAGAGKHGPVEATVEAEKDGVSLRVSTIGARPEFTHGILSLELEGAFAGGGGRLNSLISSGHWPRNQWILAGAMIDGQEDVAVLVVIRDDNKPVPVREQEPALVRSEFELLVTLDLCQVKGVDLRTLEGNHRGREADAARWLRGRTDPVRTRCFTIRAGEKAGAYEQEGDEHRLSMELVANTAAREPVRKPAELAGEVDSTRPEVLNVQVELGGKDFSDPKLRKLEGSAVIESGVPVFHFGPAAKSGEVPVLVVTPVVRKVFQGVFRDPAKKSPSGEGDQP